MVSFNSILQSCKIKGSDGRPLLGAGHIEAVCRQVGHRWRDGKLPPGETVQCLMRQMAQGNASCAAVRQMHGGAFSGEAYCQARQRLPLEVLEKLNHDVSEAVMKKARQRGIECDRCQWKGHDIFINDGSSFTMSDTPELVEHFGLHSNQKAGCGLPLCHLLFQTGPGGAATRAICSPYRTGDMTDINQVQETLKPGDVVTRIEGMPIEHPEEAIEAFNALQVASELRVDYERDGVARILRYRIVDDDAPAPLPAAKPAK